jgi:hypothetical protein
MEKFHKIKSIYECRKKSSKNNLNFTWPQNSFPEINKISPKNQPLRNDAKSSQDSRSGPASKRSLHLQNACRIRNSRNAAHARIFVRRVCTACRE